MESQTECNTMISKSVEGSKLPGDCKSKLEPRVAFGTSRAL